ncbi:hypothetical protein BU26DRAFT_517251 [Trematosphaeria pertusa]|uniref:Transcription initiation factor TFIID subunit 1 histone acetyltransferase domain-containing protein n=1 Tax=Trematosphaeria pertusa TaxID=390896 RepID=A0A6A6IS78_9PLEO|nr:uncharacterized protein BU26DRAFT_517251 [Trematosphaeria pertusa]KAF2252672.1 hypothetical protein BU26DRAFT_517251 [Trematosphaeria pertusa]
MDSNSDAFAAANGSGGNDDELSKLFQEAAAPSADGGNFWEELNTRPLEAGEKADDAIDFEDISDDDLPEEEDADGDVDGGDLRLSGTTVRDFSGDGHEEEDDLADLFGDGGSSPMQERSHHDNIPVASIEPHAQGQASGVGLRAGDSGQKVQPAFRAVNYGPAQDEDDNDPELREQMALFEAARRGHEDRLPPAPQTSKEVFDQIWPGFEPGKPPRFASLIPRKRAYFVPREPFRAMRALSSINKLNLDIAPDQEKSFRLPTTSAPTKFGRQLEEDKGGIVYITEGMQQEGDSSDDMEMEGSDTLNEQEKFGNVSWGDLQIACEDWDTHSVATLSDEDDLMTPPEGVADGDDWIRDLAEHPPKKRKLGGREKPIQFSVYDRMDLPAWDDPELATAKLSKKIILDMNDPHLLLDIQQPNAEQKKPRTIGLGLKRDNRGSLANPMFKRYNISNDEAYDALKESSQQKVRGTIGHMNIEHSLPALKLQYPFYKVNLSDRELRSFHRPTITFKPGERASISPLKSFKRKHKKNLKPSEAFAVAEDLNVGDNSEVILAEYSEEYPTTLSNFGMGVKILNYYRRTSNEDNFRPRPPIGETSVLLPQDKSPFSLFGQVQAGAGNEVLTLHNAMYRAPVFTHKTPDTDFLVSRSHTGINGSKYYLRKIDNLMVVGQEFPSVEVPGTHARKVTEASKKRLKMLAFRLYRKGQERGARQPWVSNEMIKHHLPGTEIAQNRSRMREIMKYVKETGTWEPLPGETIPDEPALRTWIKPEDICLIDSMHAGDKQLQDAGIKTNEIQDDEEGDGNEALELKLAPWHTTKNFLNACAGKAMLELHGDGDPTARGEAFSFIKVSMKGGFKDVGESTADKIDAKKQKENGGHSYNVQRQQQMYEKAIDRIWGLQMKSLKSTAAHSDVEMDGDSGTHPNAIRGRSEAATPALMRAEDETMSQFSRNSANETRGKKLRITRIVKNKYDEYEEQVTTVTDPEVIKLYLKRKKQERLMNMRIDDIKPTGDAEYDHQQMLKLKAEHARLLRNMERREGREKAKGLHRSQTGGDTPGAGTGKATPRKCANCGEVGHIKTNKKLCPLLNGQKKQSDTFKDASAASPVTVAATPISATPQTASSPQ